MKRLLIILSCLFCSSLQAENQQQKQLFLEKLDQIKHQSSLVGIATSFLGTPYVAGTLEVNREESLVVNLTQLDCTTYVENALALYRLKLEQSLDLAAFKQRLTEIRYRDGELKGYTSRLHYFTEWLENNERKGLIKNITADIGGVALQKDINFMSTHPDAYTALNENNVADIKQVERQLSSAVQHYLPINQINQAADKILSGDILAIVTNIKGLDVTHTGFAYKGADGVLKLLHASTKSGVVISDQPLVDYLAANKRNLGVIVARAL